MMSDMVEFRLLETRSRLSGVTETADHEGWRVLGPVRPCEAMLFESWILNDPASRRRRDRKYAC